VVPLFCARFLKVHHDAAHGKGRISIGARFNRIFNSGFQKFLRTYDRLVEHTLNAPLAVVMVVVALFVGCVAMIGGAMDVED